MGVIHYGSPGAEPPPKTACQRAGVPGQQQSSYTAEVTCKVCRRTADWKFANYSQMRCGTSRPKVKP